MLVSSSVRLSSVTRLKLSVITSVISSRFTGNHRLRIADVSRDTAKTTKRHAYNEDSDQSAHLCYLTRFFVFHMKTFGPLAIHGVSRLI